MGRVEREAHRIKRIERSGGLIMTHGQIFKSAKWIECSGSDAPLFRKTFTAKKGEKAEITICGLGFFKFFINSMNSWLVVVFAIFRYLD